MGPNSSLSTCAPQKRVIVGLYSSRVEKFSFSNCFDVWETNFEGRGVFFSILNSLLFEFLHVMNRLPIMWEQRFFN